MNHSSTSEEPSFHYSHLIKTHAEVEDYFKLLSGINVSKLKLVEFEAPEVVSINISGKVSQFINNVNHFLIL